MDKVWDLNLQLLTFAPIAQLDRVTDYESVGRVFESPWAHQSIIFIHI